MTTPATIPLGTTPGGAPATTLALHCGEAQIAPAIARLLGESSTTATRITLPGGAWWLAQVAAMTEGRVKRFLLGGKLPVKEVAQRILGPQPLRDVILIGHQDCSWYRQLNRDATPGQLVRAQGEDMLRARNEILRWAPHPLAVDGWMLIVDESGETTARRLF